MGNKQSLKNRNMGVHTFSFTRNAVHMFFFTWFG
jgi:hypothetical protein